MGGDGGSIPKRDDLVKTRGKAEQKDKDASRVAQWTYCQISQNPLRQPIVACTLGRLYNKEAVIEFLLDRGSYEAASTFDHIKSLKDVKELNLTPNPAYTKPTADVGDRYVDQIAPYICPITSQEMAGKYRFSYLLTCGCVFAERALREVKSTTCNKCGKPYGEEDIIPLNPSGEEIEQLRTKIELRRATSKKAKKRQLQEKSSETTTGVKHAKLVGSLKQNINNGDTRSRLEGKSVKIQEDPKATKTFKSLFTTCEDAKKKEGKAHWVTYNPLYN